MNTQPDHPYLAEAVRRAASPQTEAECRERIAEKAQAAFFTVAKMRTNTEQLLFEAKSVVQDLNQRDYLGQRAFDELLIAECRRLVGGDELKARLLASAALE